jgi:hypothetical protein
LKKFLAIFDPPRPVEGLQFSTAKFIFLRPVLSYLAVATATWQLMKINNEDN